MKLKFNKIILKLQDSIDIHKLPQLVEVRLWFYVICQALGIELSPIRMKFHVDLSK